jgi:hypothetical protein
MTIEAIEAHALNALSVNPGSIDAIDKMLLISEIRRLRLVIDNLRHERNPNA